MVGTVKCSIGKTIIGIGYLASKVKSLRLG